ncbi:hypothetical protein IFM89_013586 [Coptis chinensis]|uniref:Uncharacterized protein n=1 Tax=Coptis chinensis TaxID=261450 RepID=A0A835LJ65_9MAGN|nr:hypothetical protein IFM89_013586 [Coptis chinensis]
MGSKWRKAKVALGMSLCVYVPKTIEDASSFSDNNVLGRSSASSSPSGQQRLNSHSPLISPSTPKPSSSSKLLSKSISRSSKKICAICLGTMKPGQGHAIFTAECSHAFHFNCIASNVKHGNQVCPVCRAKWKEVPFQGPVEQPHGKTRMNPLDWPQDDAWMTVLRRLPPRSNPHRHIASNLPEPEPGVFDDDEPLGHQTETVDKCSSTPDKNLPGSMDVKIYPEVSAVQQSVSRENFSVLIHLKAPVTNSVCNYSRSQVNLPPSSQTSRVPVDLVTVLDVSGSMAGTKIALLKRAMGFVIQNLGPSDRLSVIAFSSTARRLFPLCRMTDSGRQRALQAVNSLVSNGGTNIAEGLRKGSKVMEERREKNPVGSIILLSDGQDTYSVSCQDRAHTRPDYQSLLPFPIRGGGNSVFQIPVHAFGFGADHDAASMHSISEASGGTFSFIEAEGVIQDAFAQCIGGLLSVVVQDLRVGIECVHPDIRLGPLKAGSYATEVMNDSRTGFINVGDLDPVSKETLTLEGKEVRIERPEIVREQVVSLEVDRQRNRVQAAEAMAEARVAAERGDLSSAVLILESFRRVLSESASARAGDSLCIALDAELKEMQERMASRRTYEVSGRAYVLSGLSSHSWQRATARGDSTDSTSLVHAYQTPSMVDMVTQSQTILLGGASSQPPVRPGRSFPVQPQPR